MLGADVILFANSYKCPLDKRCENCVLNPFTEIPQAELYGEIQKLDQADKNRLVEECESCQETQSFFKLQRA